jgi:predicted transcriptional regulator
MNSVKQQLREILDQLPDDCSFDDVHYQLYVVETIRKRAKAADRGDFASQAEVEQRLSKWLAK